MAITVTYNPQLSVAESLTLGEDNASNPTITHTISGLGGTFTATSSVPVAYVWEDNGTIPATPFTNSLDLAALTRTVLTTLNVTSTKLQFIQFQAGTANTGTITVKPATVEGYNLFGTSGLIVCAAGWQITLFCNETGAEITNDTDDKLALVGTVEGDTYKILMVFG